MVFKKILISFLIWKVVTLGYAYLATPLLPLKPEFTALPYWARADFPAPYWVWIWGNFDGVHYLDIAKRGYQMLEQPFFPLYPLLLRWVSLLFRLPYLISGQVISNLAFFIALAVVAKLSAVDQKKHLQTMVLSAIIFFPTSYFYGAVYNDAVFFLLASLSLYLARRRAWLTASATGALATLARLNGLALLFFLLTEYLSQNQLKIDATWNFSKLAYSLKQFLQKRFFTLKKISLLAFIPLAFLGYLLFVQSKFGDWTLIFSSMKIWGQDRITFPLVVFWRYLKIIFLYPTFKLNYWVAVFELSMISFYILLLIYAYRKIRFSYWIFLALSLLIPSLTGTFQGMPRYGLHLYPLFLALALYLETKPAWATWVYFLISLALMFFSLALFTRGYFVA